MRTLGIDLGTTFSVVATLDSAGRPMILPNPLGEEATPSVVCFESPGSVLVGSAAYNAGPAFPDRTVALIKRQMGTDRLLRFDGVEYTPEAVSALILRALVHGVLPGHRPESGRTVPAVVTVPAYFGIREREATQQACLLAGVRPLELVSEPVAAAVHYGFSDVAGIGTALVYDLGGGTFDGTVLSLGGRIQVAATDGDTELGGADWDRRLVSFLLEQFLARVEPADDPADDEVFMAELLLTAERVKRALSSTSVHRVPIRYGGRGVTVTVSRDDFEAASRDLVDRSLVVLRRLLDAAGRAGVAEIDHCLLVGGSSKMPMIAAALAAEFGWRPRLFDPDLAVAKGAALRAHQLTQLAVQDRPETGDREPGPRRTRPWTRGGGADGGGSTPVRVDWRRPDAAVVPVEAAPEFSPPGGSGLSIAPAASVASRGLGPLVHDSHDRTGEHRFVAHVIHQNDPLPVANRELTLATILDNQRSVRIEVYEQAGAVESAEVADNRPVLDGELTGLPERLPAGSPIRLSLGLGLDGRLSITASEPGSGASLTLEACIDGVLDRAGRETVAHDLAALTVRH
ncbi:Hsp70 family protein [Plantactinospora soyae]|uniref:Molecular chaperone DnaK (HSP70) n=1 Tax=Plantactinospora soyae TaxID=1544732 RepID=A0A927RBQ0_9ACTN|nr:Hsp70 family protein [Plantactinospora soyae]MBE1491926.1 molecular chaperone DnaK (HSP70) [Plantactinospora soyae]